MSLSDRPYDSNINYAAQARVSGPMNRITAQVETMKAMAERVNSATERVARHAHMLGFFEPPTKDVGQAPTPVISSMSDAIQELDQSIDRLAAALNLFD